MAQPVIPNLSATPLITTPDAQIGYIVRHYIQSPKSMSDTFFNQSVSLQDTISRHGNNRAEIPEIIKQELRQVVNRLFPDGLNVVDVSTEDGESGNRYNIVISVRVTVGDQTYMLDSRTNIVDGRIILPTDQFNS